MKKVIDLYKKYEEIINYVIVGGLTTFVSLITYYLCVLTFLDPYNSVELQIANVISWVMAVLFAYFANRLFVFKSNNKNKLKEFGDFVKARIMTLLIDMGLMYLLVTLLSFNDKGAKLIVQVIVLVLNYLFSKLFVFKK